MFFKKIKKYASLFLLTFVILPINTLAYSKYLIAGGNNIGIEIQSKGIVIVGTYEINNQNPALKAGLIPGDIIINVDNISITTINEFIDVVNKNKTQELKIKYNRNDKEYTTKLSVYSDSGVLKTGLYVKDTITGIGTLSYIDPETKSFGALGHEIVEKNTNQILEINKGTIFESKVINIERSQAGTPGSKTAEYFSDKIKGTVSKNTKNGIFGIYSDTISTSKLYKVAEIKDIKLGKAFIKTVINGNEIKEYEINILKINTDKNTNRNILFEIIDQELLEKTGGIVQGMSGSTIIQGDYIIGAVNFVLVDEPNKGYGVFITNMLEESEK
ncbi:MAG: SpoIVB peptidase S55 domain-containing protein [Bacilli bacterium]|nr:SpoIVB peptidase S55 domain-containing protein [Bacilli bacterium]